MSFAPAVSSSIPGLVNAFVSHMTFENTSAAVNTMEATFYGSLRCGVVSLPNGILQTARENTARWVNWWKGTSIAYVTEIQTLFNMINVGLIALSAKKLFDEVQGKFPFSVAKDGYGVWGLKATSLVAVVAGLTFLAWKLAHRITPPLADPRTVTKNELLNVPIGVIGGEENEDVGENGEDVGEENEDVEVNNEDVGENGEAQIVYVQVQRTDTVEIAEGRSANQQIGKALQVAKLALDIALACFVKNKFALALSVAMTGYSLWKNMQLKWMTFTRSFPIPPRLDHDVGVLKPTYHMFVFPASAAQTAEPCAVCADATAAKVGFCASDAFCEGCLANITHYKSHLFANVENLTKVTTDHTRNGVHTHYTYSYHGSIEPENLPECSECRDVPWQNELSMKVFDRSLDESGNQWYTAKMVINRPPVDRQYLFERFYAVYNAAQATLVYLQTYPELAGAIYKIQKIMLVTDCIGYATTAYYLYKKINAKYNPENSTIFKVGTVAGIALTAALSWYVMLQINTYLKSLIILNDVVKQTGLSAEILKTLGFSFNSPLAAKAMQALLVNRIIASAALTFFSEQKKVSLFSLASQLASLAGFSMLTWIEVIQTLQDPLKKIVEGGGKLAASTKASELTSLTAKHHFLIASACKDHLQSTLKSIAEFSASFFDNSSWYSYWKIYRSQYGIETSRCLVYEVTIKNNPIVACGGSIAPQLTDTAINVVSTLYKVTQTIIHAA